MTKVHFYDILYGWSILPYLHTNTASYLHQTKLIIVPITDAIDKCNTTSKFILSSIINFRCPSARIINIKSINICNSFTYKPVKSFLTVSCN